MLPAVIHVNTRPCGVFLFICFAFYWGWEGGRKNSYYLQASEGSEVLEGLCNTLWQGLLP